MIKFNGVSSKFLPYYISWFAFIDRKDLIRKQKEKILSVIISKTDLKPTRKLNKLEPINLYKSKRKTRN